MNILELDNVLKICKIIWPWLKEEYIEINSEVKKKDNLSFTISFNKLTNFHYMIDSIDVSIKDLESNKPELKIKTHAPYFSPEMKQRFNLNKADLKEKINEIQQLLKRSC